MANRPRHDSPVVKLIICALLRANPADRVKILLGKLNSIMISKNRGSKISKKAELLFNKFVKQVDKIFKNLLKALEWRSFFNNDLPLLVDICKEVQEVSIQQRPWPRPLAQTWHAKTEFYSFHFRSIRGVTEFSKQVAPGQAGIANLVFDIEFLKKLIAHM